MIGGCQTIISRPNAKTTLPLEKEGFRLSSCIRGLGLEQRSYCELSRLAILKEHRSEAVLEMLIRFEIAYAKHIGINYIFINAPIVQARAYRKFCRNLGFDFQLLHRTIAMPVQDVYQRLNRVVLSVMPFDENETIDLNGLDIPAAFLPHVQREKATA